MDFLHAIEQSDFAAWIRESPSIWAYPMILFMHTVGLGFLVGTSAIIDLRILGAAPSLELEPLERFYPAVWIGFWISAVSGALLWVADAESMTRNPLFLAKIGIIVLSMVCVRLIRGRVFRNPSGAIAVSRGAQVLAVVSLTLWLGAITAGRLTAYLK